MTQLMNQLISDEAVYRTAPATPGLLMIYVIFEISCIIFKKNIFFLNSHFFKTVILGYFIFLAKNTPQITRVVKKNGQNHQFALLSFTFHLKKSTFWH